MKNSRWFVLTLLAVGTMINYLDRTVLGIAAPRVAKEFHLSPEVMGVLLSAFSWAYVAGQIPGGMLLDRIGARLTYFIAVTGWSIFTLFHGLASGLYSLMGARLGLGICEAPCFPTNNDAVTTWFPQQERARATAIYTVGEYLGLACFGPALGWIAARFGWRGMFIAVGAAGVLFGAIWLAAYRDPETAVPRTRTPASPQQVKQLLSARQVWGACLGQFGGYSTMVFFLTWFPTYLSTERHMEWISVGWFAVLPFLAGGTGVMFGGWLSDAVLRNTGSVNLARKLPVLMGLFGATVIIGANYAASDAVVIAILSFAFFSQGMTGLGWAIISDIAPLDLMGLTGAIFSFVTNLAGIATPIVIGVILQHTGSFYYALAYTGAVALMGAAAYLFLLGDVKRVALNSNMIVR